MREPAPPVPAPSPTPVSARRRRLPLVLGVALLVVLLLLAGLRLLVASQTSPAALAARMESLIDARVEIADTSLSLLRLPAQVRLSGFRLAGRDALANNAVPLRQRPPVQRWFIGADEVTLEASLWSLLTGRILVEDLRLKGATLDAVINKKGQWNVTKLFDEPGIVNGKPNPRKAAKAPEAGAPDEPSFAGPQASDFPMAAEVKHVLFEGSDLQAFLKKKETLVDLSGLRLEIDGLDIDPADLAHHNGGRLRLQGVVKVGKPDSQVEFAIFHIQGEGTVRPFDPATGVFNPLAEARVVLQDPSTISLLPSLQKIAKKVEVLRKFGIDVVDEIGESVDFTPGTVLDTRFADGRLVTVTPLRARAGTLEIELESGGWVAPASNDHFLNAVLLANDELSSSLRQQVKEKSASIPGAKAKEQFVAELEKSLFPEGKFRPAFSSQGDLGDPDVELTNPLPDMGKFLRGVLEDIGVNPEDAKALEEVGRSLLDGLFKKNQGKEKTN